ncbi:MAG: UDP-N-acetylmuramoyl-L-alanyl-D-glutamate--2,6-diaminopimelate ligase [Lachnospiraceae bacterium]|jgi:UDP-N-acetylmuramoyl-L-alanyl-D-glutamate--2,6-diaminopimelate ligase|nr:UDP-N-acetylmuramoyl-L-alanyl-D-glutamate--2,6-diaminopimelate ligase [Lachnospiraceae bacterium]
MLLIEMLKGIPCRLIRGDLNIEIAALTSDSRKARESALFVCIRGHETDGHSYIKDVCEKGAAAILIEDETLIPADVSDYPNVTIIQSDDTRYAFALLSATWFGHPAKKLKVIGITGTKGKTTSTYMIKSVLEGAGIKTGLIGTIETDFGDGSEPIEAKNTTPESYEIQETFAKMLEKGCTHVVMEVSSQGLKLHRTAGVPFEIGVFTNLGNDHIGPNEHDSFDEYKECKSRLFKQCKIGIGNANDEHFEDVFKNATCDVVSYKINAAGYNVHIALQDSEYNGTNITSYTATGLKLINGEGYLGVDFHVNELDLDVNLHMPGEFSVSNAVAAIAVCDTLGVEKDVIKKALENAFVKGRIERVNVSPDFVVLIDYAHNAMSLETLLLTLKEYKPKRIVTVFGCGGNRSKDRRYDMGEVSGRLSDFTVITSDNPRFEEPQDIINDIITGIKRTNGKYVTIPDRKEGIRYAIKTAIEGDVIVIAGKGHETYQEIRGVKHHMDDRELIRECTLTY